MSEEQRTRGDIEDWFSADTILGILIGAGAGVWGALVHHSLEHEETILLAVGTADIALLAVVLAAVALMAGFLNGFFGRVIEAASPTWTFFYPFEIVAWVSGIGGLVAFAGAIDASHGSKDTRAVVFGIAIFLSTWAVFGTILLVREFIKAAIEQREEVLRREKDSSAGQLRLTEESVGVTVIIEQRPSASEPPADAGA